MEKKPLKPFHLALILFGVNIVWRLIWMIPSKGVYTDGILQITAFQNGLTFWPPLYTLLAYTFGWIPGLGLEGSARIWSLLLGSFAVVPIEMIGRRLFGARAGFQAAICYTLSPIPLRWSVTVMTDATFMTLWIGSLATMLVAAHLLWPDQFEQGKDKEKAKANPQSAVLWFALASTLAVLATLTRYQGIALLPIIFIAVIKASKAKVDGEPVPNGPFYLSLTPWVLLPLWILVSVLRSQSMESHISQFAERMGQNPLQTIINYYYLFEQFLMGAPYFVTYGIFGFFLYGLFRIKYSTKRIYWSIIAAGFLTLFILLIQSAFQAFQSRYLLPIIPFIVIIAGHGLSVWEKHCQGKMSRYWILVGPTFLYATVFSCLVVFYQGNAFSDIKKAGKWIKANAAEDATIYSTEVYNADIGAAKLSYWSGREVRPFQWQLLEPGDFIVLPSFYGAYGVNVGEYIGQPGWSQYTWFLDQVKAVEYTKARKDAVANYPATVVETFGYSTYPLLPDVMEEPLTHTNPLAWYLRYRRQRFETTILRVISFEEAIEAAEKGKKLDKGSESDILSDSGISLPAETAPEAEDDAEAIE